MVNKDLFKSALKQSREIDQISFHGRTCVNVNKNIEDFIFLSHCFICI